MAKKKRIQAWLKPETFDQLTELAEHDLSRRSAIVRFAVEKHLKEKLKTKHLNHHE